MVVIYTVRILQDREDHNEAFTILSNIFPNYEIMIYTNLSLCNTLNLTVNFCHTQPYNLPPVSKSLAYWVSVRFNKHSFIKFQLASIKITFQYDGPVDRFIQRRDFLLVCSQTKVNFLLDSVS